MKKYKLTDNQRNGLTEFLGECWHNIKRSAVGISPFTVEVCSKCKEVLSNSVMIYKENRTFTTDSDMMAVRRALRDKGLWHNFFNYLVWIDPIPCKFHAGEFWLNRESIIYLDKNPERFCWLVAKFLEERK